MPKQTRPTRPLWHDRFSRPEIDDLIEAIGRDHRSHFVKLREHLGKTEELTETLEWRGLPWRWALVYRLADDEEAVVYLVPNPEVPSAVMHVTHGEARDLPVRKFSRYVREGLGSAPSGGGRLVAGVADPGGEQRERPLAALQAALQEPHRAGRLSVRCRSRSPRADASAARYARADTEDPMIRIHTRFALLAGLAALLCAPALGQTLQRRIEGLIRDAGVGDARVGVRVVDLETGQSVVSRDADTPFIPASNMKLLTSGAALMTLGPDHVYRTEIALDGTTVIVRAGGDPAFADPEVLRNTEPRLNTDDFLRTLVRAIEGKLDGPCAEVIVDDRVFDREFVHPSWDPNDLNKRYAPQVSGLCFHGNLLAIFVSPAPGGAPSVQTQPSAGWIAIENRARTVGAGANTHWASREPTANRFTLFGDVRSTPPIPLNTPTHDNALLFGQLLADRLVRAGTPVGGASSIGLAPPAAVRTATPDEDLPAGRLCAVVTTPISEVLTRCNTDSANLYAEALLKLIGHEVTHEPGSWSSGASVLRMLLQERLGSPAAASTVIADGSGLSHENLVTPRTLTDWLANLAVDQSLREPFMLSLATPGRGTFTRRFGGMDFDNHVAGKSGVLTGVRTLSGYVVGREGRVVAFSILANDVPSGSGPKATRLADRIVEQIDEYVSAVEGASASAQGG